MNFFDIDGVGTLRVRYAGHQREGAVHLLVPAGLHACYECIAYQEAYGFQFADGDPKEESRFKHDRLRPKELSRGALAEAPPSAPPKFTVENWDERAGLLQLKMAIPIDGGKLGLSGVGYASMELVFAPLSWIC